MIYSILFLIVGLILGLFLLISGKIRVGKMLFLEGRKARIAGLIFLFSLGFVIVATAIEIILQSMEMVSEAKAFKQAIDYSVPSLTISVIILGLAYISFHSPLPETKSRGGCLASWLIYEVIIAIYSLAWYLWYLQTDGGNSQWIYTATIWINIFLIITFVGIWLWRKWGTYGYIILILIQAVMAFINYLYILQAFLAVIQLSLWILTLYLLLKPKWQFFN